MHHRLAGIQGNSILKGIKTGNYVRNVPSPLKLGQLRGNKFRIVIRDVQHRTNSRFATSCSYTGTRGVQFIYNTCLFHVELWIE